MLKFYNQAKVLLYINEIENQIPVFLEIHPALACNQKCVWCRYEHDSSKLTIDDINNVLSKYPSIAGIRITGGGEPLMNIDVVEYLLMRCMDAHISASLETNGELLTDDMIKLVGKSCTYCRISLDAATAETYQKLHGSKHYEKVLDNISKLRQSGVGELGLSYLVVPENVLEILQLAELRLPVDYIHFKPIMQGMDSKTRHLAMLLLEHWDKTGMQPRIRYDRIEQDDDCNNKIPCRITNIIRVLGGDGKEYVCCEKAYQPEFEVGVWSGSTRQCFSCRYNGYNEILESYYKNTMTREFL